MQKVYLLLRNNQQTGPHSLEELLQLNVKPFDLIWVEGKSYGWSYPSEIETLKPFVTAASSQKIETPPVQQPSTEPSLPNRNKAVPKKIFVSLPTGSVIAPASSSQAPDAIEQKAEELRKRIQSYSPQKITEEEEVKTNYARSLTDVEEDYTSWVYRKKTKKKKYFNNKYWFAGSIIVIGSAGIWLMAKTVYEKPVTQPQQFTVQNSNKEEITGFPSETRQSSTAVVTKSKSSGQPLTLNTSKKPKKKIELPANAKKAEAKPLSEEVIQKDPPVQLIKTTEPVVEEKKNEPAVAETPKEKKKSLKQILGGLFKKNKKDESVQEEPRSADNSNNERNATHRDETSIEPITVDLAEQVDVKMNKTSDDWMMGVQGLKLTLYNRSTTILKSAAVEVLYYSEQNNLLDKKTVYFSNVASKKSQTIVAPDHRMADHVEYKIISATGVGNAYAKQ
jgi:hypothetical protein